MKFIFIVQREGRGHMTQAISLFKILKKNGHDIGRVIVGKSRWRALPQFFENQIDAPIVQLESLNLATDKNSKSVKIFKTVIVNFLKLRVLLRSVKEIHKIAQKEKPDVIINFYELLGGLYFFLKKSEARHVVIAHQFFLEHPEFEFPKRRLLDKQSLKFSNWLAGYSAKKRLALSFQSFPDKAEKKLFIVPPLLRDEVKIHGISQENHFLVYLVNHGYSDQVEKFHAEHPEIPIHCFWDNKDAPEVDQRNKNLTFHQLNDKKFIALMSSCKGYLTTAGFESVCEAMYMGKPALMVPVKGHYEQTCNAVDAQKVGAGISSEIFNLKILLNYLPDYQNVQDVFQKWCDKTEILFIKNLTEDVN